MRAQTEKTTFSCKDDCILTKHTQRWTYSPLFQLATFVVLVFYVIKMPTYLKTISFFLLYTNILDIFKSGVNSPTKVILYRNNV